ncbi:ankyrin repeat domain-containing protein 66-like isoform X2 [Clytia hemisphaerica]|uniref:ankyrin repeat domain-containing protein 66-like isoform X2 n=1 Tax=Clytia hemisphaerica TaxID=252671 RepID=UPI0034D70FEB
MERKMSRRPRRSFVTIDDTSLYEASYLGNSHLLERLVALSYIKAQISKPDEEWGFRTALHIAASRGHIECCEILLENGADPTLRMYDGWTPAHCAAEIGNIEVLKLLIRYSGTVVAKDDAGATPRHIAKTYGHKDCATFLKAVEEHPSQKQEIIRDRIQNAARRTLLKIQKE